MQFGKLCDVLDGISAGEVPFALPVPSNSRNPANTYLALTPQEAHGLMLLSASNGAHFRGSKTTADTTMGNGLQELTGNGNPIRPYADVEFFHELAVVDTDSGQIGCISVEAPWKHEPRDGICCECKQPTMGLWMCMLAAEGSAPVVRACCEDCARMEGGCWSPSFESFASIILTKLQALCTTHVAGVLNSECAVKGGEPQGTFDVKVHVASAHCEKIGKVSFHVTVEITLDGAQCAFSRVHDVRRLLSLAAERMESIPPWMMGGPQERLVKAFRALGTTRKSLSDAEAPGFDPAVFSNAKPDPSVKEPTRCWRVFGARKLDNQTKKWVRPLVMHGHKQTIPDFSTWLQTLANVVGEQPPVMLKFKSTDAFVFRSMERATRPDFVPVQVGKKRLRAACQPADFDGYALLRMLFSCPHFVPSFPPNARVKSSSVSVKPDECMVRFHLDGVNAHFCRCKQHQTEGKDSYHRGNTVWYELRYTDTTLSLQQICFNGSPCRFRADVLVHDDMRFLLGLSQ